MATSPEILTGSPSSALFSFFLVGRLQHNPYSNLSNLEDHDVFWVNYAKLGEGLEVDQLWSPVQLCQAASLKPWDQMSLTKKPWPSTIGKETLGATYLSYLDPGIDFADVKRKLIDFATWLLVPADVKRKVQAGFVRPFVAHL